MAVLVRSIETVPPRSSDVFGGKAAGLASLVRAGFQVPSAVAVSVDASEEFFRVALSPEERPEAWISRAEEPSAEWLGSLRAKLERTELPESFVRPVVRAFHKLLSDGAPGIAVRSSSSAEDRDHTSAAGMHHTALHVVDDDGLLRAIRACFSSFFTPGVAAYLRAKAADPRSRAEVRPAIALVLQAMVPAQVSGVLFTANPLTSDRGELLINASWGLGAAVVDGKVSPDSFRIEKRSGEIRDRVLGQKATRIVVADGGGTRQESVEQTARAISCLDARALASLWRLGRRIEAHFGQPRDVEFAFADGALFVL